MNQILEERDACGVGFIASLKGEKTHKTITDALTALGCMEHRGACSADDDSGDGAGIMCDIPWKMLGKWCDANGVEGFAEGAAGVGMVFLPQDEAQAAKGKELLETAIVAEGLEVLAWRDVPVNKEVVGRMAKDTEPVIVQVLVAGAEGAAYAKLTIDVSCATAAHVTLLKTQLSDSFADAQSASFLLDIAVIEEPVVYDECNGCGGVTHRDVAAGVVGGLAAALVVGTAVFVVTRRYYRRGPGLLGGSARRPVLSTDPLSSSTPYLSSTQ